MLNAVKYLLLRNKHGFSQIQRGIAQFHPINEDIFGLSESQRQVIFFCFILLKSLNWERNTKVDWMLESWATLRFYFFILLLGTIIYSWKHFNRKRVFFKIPCSFQSKILKMVFYCNFKYLTALFKVRKILPTLDFIIQNFE